MPVERSLSHARKAPFCHWYIKSLNNKNVRYLPIKESMYPKPHLFPNWKIGPHPSYTILKGYTDTTS